MEVVNSEVKVEPEIVVSNGEVKEESEKKGTDKETLLAVIQVCKKFNLKETEEILKKEANLTEDEVKELTSASIDHDVNITNVLSTYKSEGDPDLYAESFRKLIKFVETSLDVYKHELITIQYPIFVHMYLELVYNNHEEQASKFMSKFGPLQEDYYQDDIKKLAVVVKREHMKGNEIIDNFRSGHSLFTVRLSRDTYNYLKRYLQENANILSVVQNIIQEHLFLDIYEGMTRSKQQVESSVGGVMGEASRQANKARVYYGLLKEPEINITIPDDDADDNNPENVGEGEKPKKKKAKKDPLLCKKSRNDPNAPPNNRIPLPELRDAEKLDKVTAMREATKRLKLGPESLPSICFYTLLNAGNHHNTAALCVEISEDSHLLASGYSDSTIRVWSLTPIKLKSMKSAEELELIDKEADDVLFRMMDEKNTTDMKILHGHNGPVYAVSFSPDRTLLLSCSEDSTIRLWSLQTWTNLCAYKGHCFPVWDIRFSPHGYYFVSASHDRTARLWATDCHQPLRLFAGHISDVDCVQFHPNSNYVASGSTDRTVRLWDVLNGQCVRLFTGHKARIYTLAFTTCGRFLVSAGADKKIIFWDLAHGYLIAELSGHHDTIYSLCFSRDGVMLASGGNDDCIKLWDIARLLDELDVEDINMSQTPVVRTNTENILLGSYRTKSTSILCLHFTRRNLLLSAGIFH
ncbi:transcription initiation factor TFIID subunit 5-like protein [Dinothrombium tinctorium]|uniref:Transcription initiation factor TFIID subunit 5 n=1 Tax=Dinothrombium tinctorium TaxID=1965070 RepID=A0A3S3P6P0_9ACAR|nr:transcription initiation factor TFIID subunit 5-like protein [Dinothrombium tinctorium]